MSLRYDWLPTECAPLGYPAEILRGSMLFEDGSSLYIPERKPLANGWGSIGSVHIQEEETFALPVEVRLIWLSIPENQIYAGHFKLPRSRLARLFEEGVTDPFDGTCETYNYIAVGMAPGGDVMVWVTDGRFTRSVMGFQGTPYAADWRKIEPTFGRTDYMREAWIAAVPQEALRAKVMAEEVPLGQWELWRRRFAWTPSVTCDGTLQTLWIDSLNGEKEIYPAQGWEDGWPDRAAPAALRAAWIDGEGDRLLAHITLDAQESFAAFTRFAERRDPALGRIALEVELSGWFPDAAVTLRDSQLALPLEKCKVEVFRQ